ncbi:MAG: hypothetical protein Kow00121_20280 [Elainellaceae cyanobacterium]
MAEAHKPSSKSLAEPVPVAASPETVQATSNPSPPPVLPIEANPSEDETLTIRNPLLSKVILPLPPLLLPDLLLPPYDFPSFNSQRLDEELQIYSRYLRIYGAPEVLIIGSSRSLQGIDPSALQEGLEAQGYSSVNVFNFGINGATAQVVDLVLQQILTEEQLPKLIIWGDGLRAFNDGRPDLTFNEIVASEGYRRLQTGDRPILSRTYYQETARLNATADKSLDRASTSGATPAQVVAPDLDMLGFQAVSEQFDPTTYYQQYPRVSGQFDADYVPFQLGGRQTQSTVAVARFARQQNIPLVIVNLPLTQTYLDAPRQAYEQRFRQHIQQLAQQEDFQFVNLHQYPELMQNQYFADPSHINRQGARAIALHLAADTTMPWHILQSPSDTARSDSN